MSLAPGTRLGPYEILAPLGAGGMGEVWRACDGRLGRDVAVKILPQRVMQDPSAVERFIREARASSALNHPNIVSIYDVGEAAAGHFIVMELVEGQTLRQLAGHRLDVDALVSSGTQIAKALAAAHAAGIVHRDIKPENIMVRHDGYVKVLDFGLARLIPKSHPPSGLTTATASLVGAMVGTLRYMSPEQARGDRVGSASDIFSLGLVLYELATGQHPFVADSALEVLQAILSQPALGPSRLNPEVSTTLDALVLQMLEKDPRRRPSAVEVDRMLAGLAGRRAGVESRIATVSSRRRTVGREAERAELRAGFESAASGRGLLLCVSGEPGIGKTTLVEDFLSELSTGGQLCAIGRGRCSERLAGVEAYLPWLESVDSLLHSDSGDAIARLMKLIAPTWYVQVAPLVGDDSSPERMQADIKAVSQERLKRELSAFVAEVSRVRPLLLFFDDLHWADASTIDLLAYFGSRLASMRLLLVAAYRPSELLQGRHPLVPVKLDLQARGVCRELALDFLSRENVERYLALEFPECRFPPDFPALIHAKTEGSPLFMVDLLRYLRERQMIATEQEGRWTLAQRLPAVERELPESVRSMIERKIDQLSEADRRLLAAASVQGQEFDSAVVAKALGLDAAEVEERLELLDRVYGFVRRVREQQFPDRTLTVRYRFVHVLYQNALYASLAPTRKASLSAVVAEALLGYYGDRRSEIAAGLAVLFEAARDFTHASDYFLLAAQNAARVFAHQETIVLLRRGLELLEMLPDTRERTEKELALQITLGPPLMAIQGWGHPEVEKTYARAWELCGQMVETPERFPVLIGLWNLYYMRADHKRARQLAEELFDLAQRLQDSTLLLVAHWALTETSFWLGELTSTREHSERCVALYDPRRHGSLASLYGQDPGVICWGYAGWARQLLGYPDRALDATRQALTLAHSLSSPFDVTIALWITAVVNQLRGEAQAAREWAEKAIALATEQDFPMLLAMATPSRAWAVAKEGQHGEGIAQLRQSWVAFRATGAETGKTYFRTLLVEALTEGGNVEEGLAAVTEGLTAAQSTGERSYEAELHRLKGELLLIQATGGGRTAADTQAMAEVDSSVASAAETCFREAIEIARRQQAKSWELRATTSLSRLLRRQGRRKEARQMLAEIYGWFTEGFETVDLEEAKALLEELA